MHCAKHRSDVAAEVCDHCGDLFCETCLVWVRGASAPPLCVNCALLRGGVRTSAHSIPPCPRREVRKRRKELAAALERLRARRASAGSDPAPIAASTPVVPAAPVDPLPSEAVGPAWSDWTEPDSPYATDASYAQDHPYAHDHRYAEEQPWGSAVLPAPDPGTRMG